MENIIASNKLISISLLFCIIVQIIVTAEQFQSTFPYDDAYITFRYSRNIAQGLDWVYNKNEITSGTTSFFNTILMAALNDVTKIRIDIIGRILPLIFSILSTILIGLIIVEKIKSEILGSVVIIFYTFLPPIYTAILSGMESNLFIFTILCSIYFLFKKKYLTSSILSGLLVFIRPDGLIVTSFIALYLIYQFKTIGISKVLFFISIMCFIIAAFFAINIVFFNLLYPLSMKAKMITYDKSMWIQSRFSTLRQLFQGRLALLLLPLSFYSGFMALKMKDKDMILIFTILITYVAVFTIVNPWLRPWYTSVTLSLLTILTANGIFNLINKYFNEFSLMDFFYYKKRSIKWDALKMKKSKYLLLSVTLIILYTSILFVNGYKNSFGMNRSEGFNAEVIGVGKYLKSFPLINESKVYLGDIGYIGWITNAYIIDYAGLVTPIALKFSKYKESYSEGINLDWKKQLEFIKMENPEFIVESNLYPYYRAILSKCNYLKQKYNLVFQMNNMIVYKRIDGKLKTAD